MNEQTFEITLTQDQLDRLGLDEYLSDGLSLERSVQSAINQMIDNQPCHFAVKCLEDVYVNDECYWTAGELYQVEAYADRFMADSNYSDFCGSNLSEDDFMNCFEVAEVSSVAAKAMYNQGYGDMFSKFVPAEERIKFYSDIDVIVINTEEDSLSDYHYFFDHSNGGQEVWEESTIYGVQDFINDCKRNNEDILKKVNIEGNTISMSASEADLEKFMNCVDNGYEQENGCITFNRDTADIDKTILSFCKETIENSKYGLRKDSYEKDF